MAAALTSATAASSALQPLRRGHPGELRASKIRPVPRVPAQGANGRIRVIARLDMPPLAAAYAEGLSLTSSSRRLNVNASSSRKYVARLGSMQQRAAAEIREAIPGAIVSRRFQVVLDGLTVELPVRRLPDLAGLSFVTKIYPSLGYRQTLNESTALIRAPAFWASTR